VSDLLQTALVSGLLGSSSVRIAALVGTAVALVSGVVGVHTVMRGQSFVGHSLSDIGATGGSGALFIGVNPLWGFLAMGAVAGGVLELMGLRRPRGRDVATGIVLGAELGLAALFLYWDASFRSTTGASISILFGSIFVINPAIVPVVIGFCAAAMATLLLLQRTLLLCSVSTDIASARGVPVRLVGVAHLMVMVLAVSLSALTIGAILSTALLIGPAAAALRVTRRPGLALIIAAGIGVAATWAGIALAYESYYWPPAGHGWPVSFFIVTLIFLFYLGADALSVLRGRRKARVRAPSLAAAERV
jgi:zinc/manganese transport system permease protein